MPNVILASVLFVSGSVTNRVANYPANARDLTTHKLVCNLSASPASVREACGWYALADTPPVKDGFCAIPVGYARTAEGYTRTYKLVELPPPEAEKYSVKAVIVALRAAGKWDATKAALQSSGYYEIFLGSNYLKADDADFVAACDGLVSAGLCTREELDALLSGCIWSAE